jgi:hypothetical protein
MFKLSFSFEQDDEEDEVGDGIHGYIKWLVSGPVADLWDFWPVDSSLLFSLLMLFVLSSWLNDNDEDDEVDEFGE